MHHLALPLLCLLAVGCERIEPEPLTIAGEHYAPSRFVGDDGPRELEELAGREYLRTDIVGPYVRMRYADDVYAEVKATDIEITPAKIVVAPEHGVYVHGLGDNVRWYKVARVELAARSD